MSPIFSSVEKVGFSILVFCVIGAPVPFGSNSAGMAGFFGLLLGISLIASCAVPVLRRETRRLIGAALLLSAVVAASTLIHIGAEGGVNWAHPAWSPLNGLLGTSGTNVSPTRYQPLHSVGYVLLPIAAFIACLVYVTDGNRYIQLMNTVLLVGLLATSLCLAQFVVAPRMLLWAEKQHYVGSFTGSFVNRNTAATFYGVLLVLSLSLSLRQFAETQPHRLLFLERRLAARERIRLMLLLLYVLSAIVFAMALFLTNSRAGIFSSLVGVTGVVAGFAYLALRKSLPFLKALGVSAVCVGVPVALAAALGDDWVLRLRDEGFFDEARACAYKSIWPAIKDHFWLGAGLGTFQDVFPSYRLPECGISGYWEMAHSVVLEAWLALGVTFLACVGGVYWQLVATYARGLRVRRRWRVVPLASLSVVALVTLHSLVDFSMQIPGVAVLVASVLGAGAAISLGKHPTADVREG